MLSQGRFQSFYSIFCFISAKPTFLGFYGIVFSSIIKTSYRYIDTPAVFIYMNHHWYMTDPILFISMILGLGGVFVLINSFSDDDDSDNDGGMGTYIYNLEPVKVGNH